MSNEAKNPWLQGPWIDLTIGCGGWSLPLMALAMWGNAIDMVTMSLVFYALAMFVNNPHFMATIHRAYGTRRDFCKYRFFTIYLTVFMVLTLFVLHWKPTLLPWVFTTYLVWSPFHYTGQNFGIALLLLGRRNARPNRRQRHYLHLSYLLAYALWVVALMAQASEDPKVLTLGWSKSITQPLILTLALGFLASAGYALTSLARQTSLRAILPAAVLTLSQALWFVLPNLFSFLVEIPLPSNYWSAGILAFLHCAQYLWITSYYTKREVESGQSGNDRTWRPWRYYGALVAGGIALFIPGPWIASRLFGYDLLESLFIFLALVNLHHFILDGAIWKLREGHIARLLLGQGQAESSPEKDALAGQPVFSLPKPLVYLLLAGVLTVGLIDQMQFGFTLRETSLEKIEFAEQLNERDSRVHFRKAMILYDNGRVDEAMAALDQALALNPRQLPPHYLRARILAETGHLEDAYQQYSTMLHLFQPMGPILQNAGVFALHTNRLEEAIDLYEETLRRHPDRTFIYLYLGEAHQRSGHWEDALRNYTRYLKHHPLPPLESAKPEEIAPYRDLFGAIAACYQAMGEEKEAAFWQKLQSLL